MLDPRGEYLTSAWNNHVYPLAEKIGLGMKMPSIQPRSRLAHEAAKWAETCGHMGEYHLALFKAIFVDDQDISNIDILMKLADDLNLDADDLRQSLEENRFTTQVVGDENEAMNVGVRAVPAFVVDGQLLAAGVQSVERLQDLRDGKYVTRI